MSGLDKLKVLNDHITEMLAANAGGPEWSRILSDTLMKMADYAGYGEVTKIVAAAEAKLSDDGGFEVKCLKCGSTNCDLSPGISMGSELTGCMGQWVNAECNDCKNEKQL